MILLRNNACSPSWTNPTPSAPDHSLDTSTNPDRFVYTIGKDDLVITWNYAQNNNCDFTESITINGQTPADFDWISHTDSNNILTAGYAYIY